MRLHLSVLALLLLPFCGGAQSLSDSILLKGDTLGCILERVTIETNPNPPNGADLHFGPELLQLHHNAPLADLLQEAPAVFVKSYGPSGSATPAFRGTGASHTQVFWNGLPINSPLLGLTDLSLGTVGMFEDVSLVFGAASAAYGDGGLGGAILLGNAVPKGPLAVSVGQEVASFGNSRSSIGLHGGQGKWQTSTKAHYLRGRNNFPFLNIDRIEPVLDTLEHSSLQQLSFLQQVVFQARDRDQFAARVWLNGMDRELPPTMLTTNLTESQSDRSLRASLEWSHWTYSGWSGEVKAALFQDRLHYLNGLAGIDSDTKTTQGFLDAKVRHYWKSWLFQEAGIRVNRIRATSPGYQGPLSQSNATAFSRISLTPKEGLRIGLLLRETLQANQWSLPALVADASYTWDRSRKMVYLNGGHNFRFPSFNDLHWQPGGNPDLMAENAWTAEVGTKQELLPKKSKWGLRTHLSTYLSRVENMILWVPGTGSFWSAENVQSVFVRGAEASVKLGKDAGKWRWSVEGNYALTISENRSSGAGAGQPEGMQLIYVPRHTGLVRLRISHGQSAATASQQFTGTRFTTRDNSSALPAFSLGNIRLSHHFTFSKAGLEVYAGVNNVFNTSYQTIPWRPMPGRNYLVGLNLDWRKG